MGKRKSLKRKVFVELISYPMFFSELYFMESSALTAENVDNAFFRLISKI